MTVASVESRPWSRRRWWGLVGLVFCIQLGLIFWLGETAPVRPRFAAPGLTVRLAGSASAELLALRDPTLFVLPHPEEHPAPAWLKAPQPGVHSFTWQEPTNPPLLAVDQLGAAFSRLVAMNHSGPLVPLAKPEPRLTPPDLASQTVPTGQSVVRLEDALAQRRLITPLNLRSWTSRDILTNSVVQLLVDADGLPQSVTLLSGSGSRDADQYALDQAGAARFEPLSRDPSGPAPNPTTRLSWGRMIFRWHTLPPPPTNTSAVSP
jgi:hypothetical protein